MAPVTGGISIDTPPPETTVHSHVVLIIGRINPPPPQGTPVWIANPPHPAISFPVHPNGRFKGIAPLVEGGNNIQVSCGNAATSFSLGYQRLEQNRKVSLIIMAGRDSPLTFDDVKPSSYNAAVCRLRMAAYLWQAYTAEQMRRAGFGPRTFQFETEYGVDTVSNAGVPGNIPSVTLVRSRRSMAELRGKEMAQQNKSASKAQGLYELAREAVRDDPGLMGRQGLQAAVLLMDATHDSKGNILGHAALGGSGSPFPLAIFGSHSIFSWPSSIEEVVPAFMDRRPVDRRACGVDCEGDNYGMAANVGIGAMMHEVGHMLTCPHQTSGVMLRDYTRLDQSFIATQPDDRGECNWHRLDVIRFVTHPSFALPSDNPRLPAEPGPILVTADSSNLQVYTPQSGIMAVEYRRPGKETAEPFFDTTQTRPQEYNISRQSLQGFDRVTILTSDGGRLNEMNINDMWAPRAGVLRSPSFGGTAGNRYTASFPPHITHIRVHAGLALDGVELNEVLFGKRGGSPKDWPLNQGESIMGINLRHGAWVDAIQFVTTQRISPWFGRADGGGPGESRVPRGYRLSGMFGRVGDWINAIGFEYAPLNAPPPPPEAHQQQPFQAPQQHQTGQHGMKRFLGKLLK